MYCIVNGFNNNYAGCFVVKDEGKLYKSETHWNLRLNKLKESLDKFTKEFEQKHW